jgi:heat shock protein HslJ
MPSFSSRLALVSLLAAVAVPAQAQKKAPDPVQSIRENEGAVLPKAQKTFPLGVQWLAVSLNGKSLGPDKPAFQLDQQYRARGYAGCNSFSATAYGMPGGRFAMGPVAVTRKACDKAVMDQEKAFLIALRTAQAWELKDGYLLIKGQNGEVKFERTL